MILWQQIEVLLPSLKKKAYNCNESRTLCSCIKTYVIKRYFSVSGSLGCHFFSLVKIENVSSWPPTVRLSSLTFRFPGLSSPAHTSAALLEGPNRKDRWGKASQDKCILSHYFDWEKCTLHLGDHWKIWRHSCTDTLRCKCDMWNGRLTGSCSVEVLTSCPWLLAYCSRLFSCWIIRWTSSSSLLKKRSSCPTPNATLAALASWMGITTMNHVKMPPHTSHKAI